MIVTLEGSHGPAFGFKIIGHLTSQDVEEITEKIAFAIEKHKKPMGLLVDITEMQGADWAARWDEMRFLQQHTDHIARLAIICDDEWRMVAEMVLVATAALQAETVYFLSSEIHHAWHWVKMGRLDEHMPFRLMYSGKGLFKNYTPEYMGI